MEDSFVCLQRTLTGELHWDHLIKALYATDASVYRATPLAVAYPKDTRDLVRLIDFAQSEKVSLIPRTAGTSLAGQCVGEGIVVDMSKHFTRILDINEKERTVTVQPGVIRDDLNRYLQPFDLFFGPNTSTSNRCMIGGMVGNNSSGTTSLKYGVTRDKIVSLKGLLSDGSEIVFEALDKGRFVEKQQEDTLEGHIYRTLYKTLESPSVKKEIHDHFPHPDIHRRNTGYAVDELIKMQPFDKKGSAFHLGKLICGSEGTLALITSITLRLDPLPPAEAVMVAAHFRTIAESMEAVVPLMRHDLYTCELMDKAILDRTKDNLSQRKNRFFVNGDPEAILMVELRSETKEDLQKLVEALLRTLQNETNAYAFPLLYDGQIDQAMQLRKAGLGLLGNMIGDAKAVACIEDTAVAIEDLADYIAEFSKIMDDHQQKAVYYAHAGAGEIHLRPILNLKQSEGVALFRTITQEVAQLVKKYRGSLSGEHGDGRVRAEFVPLMIGEENYRILKKVKTAFDPNAIFNPGKIVDPEPMDHSLRYKPKRKEPEIETLMDFSDSMGILRAAEKCNGSGDCRKSPMAGGTMCPSYHATRNEKDTTRGRANALREFLTHSTKPNQFDHKELKEVFDLCLSCKGCISECPSNVDIAAFKAEFLYQYQKVNGTPLRSKVFAHNARFNTMAQKVVPLSNFFFTNSFTSSIMKAVLGIHARRGIPKVSSKKLWRQFKEQVDHEQSFNRKVYLFLDEFTALQEMEIALDAVALLHGLGYGVCYLPHAESGRAALSKGVLDHVKKGTDRNIEVFKGKVTEETPLLGIEPSAILIFKDEYLRLANDRQAAHDIAKNSFLIEEFLSKELEKGRITTEQFTDKKAQVLFHGHCHQKALGDTKQTLALLNLPKNYTAMEIASGCCGMAGSFGYEREHYKISMEIGEQRLFPAVRAVSEETIVTANGTSCRHQVWDGTKRKALHPITVLRNALRGEQIENLGLK